jgi:hypothetical protein
MPKLYADGLVSDVSIALGRIAPAVRDATEVTIRATTEAAREVARKTDRAHTWLIGTYTPTLTVGVQVSVTTVRAAAATAGFSTTDINNALARIDYGSKLTYDGVNVTRRS